MVCGFVKGRAFVRTFRIHMSEQWQVGRPPQINPTRTQHQHRSPHTRLEFPTETDPKTGKPPMVVRLDEEGKALSAYGYKEGMVLGFKDLGPQIGYRTGR